MMKTMGTERRKKTTIEIPPALLQSALRVTGKSLNETVCMGLRMIAAREAYDELLKWRGKFKMDFELIRNKNDD